MNNDFVIIGAGIFGVELALKLSKKNFKVTLVEKENQILSHASKMNQNRVHLGFHYPRSLKTAKQAIESYNYFTNRFKNAIRPSMRSFYMVSNEPSRNINLNEYFSFCSKLNLDYKTVNKSFFNKYLNIDKIEDDVFLVDETVFDIDEIRKILINDLKKSSINLVMNESVNKIEILSDGNKKTTTNSNEYYSNFIVNCTYVGINDIIEDINCEIDLKFQNVLLPIISTNYYIPGITIMDGPFCSILPKGLTSNKYILSDVRKSIINEASSLSDLPDLSEINKFDEASKIIQSMKSYIKFPEDYKLTDYWLTRKALSKKNNDERLTHIFSHNNSGVYSVLQGKISTSQLVFDELMNLIK